MQKPSPLPPASPVFQQSFTLRSSECDLHQQLKLESLFQILQEMAWEHAEALQIGSQIHKQDFFWVLAGVELGVLRMPRWRETLLVKTRPMGLHGLFALRDFEVFDGDHVLIARASSAWLILNQSSRRPIRMDRHFPNFPGAQRASTAFPQVLKKLPKEEDQAEPILEKRSIRYSETDLYGHVNNAAYVRFAQDILMKYQPGSMAKAFHFSIRYTGESFPGDILHIKLNSKGQIMAKKENQVIFEAKISDSLQE
jgi:acyl-ACP thioesterase